MGKNVRLQYYAEGECEKNLLHALMHAKTSDYLILPGKIETLNPVAERISRVKAMTIKKGTSVALVFDTDTGNASILKENVKTLKQVAGLSDKNIFFLMSINCFEEELVFACQNFSDVKRFIKAFGSQGRNSFKTDFSNCRNLEEKLKQLGFDLKLMWTRSAEKPFDQFNNSGKSVRSK